VQGHVVKRGTSWTTVVDLPPGPDGKRRQKWTSGFATKKLAQRALAQLIVELDSGTHVEPTRRTVEQYLTQDWLPASAARVRPSTLRGYRQLLDSYVIPVIGDRRLDELNPLLLTKLYGQMLSTAKRRQPGTLSPRTVRFTHTVLNRAFADAVRWRLLASNPAADAQPPAASACRAPEMKTWTIEELRRFLAGTADTADHVGYVLAACAGLRRGEVCGLRWSDVELEPAVGPAHVRIRQQLVLVNNEISFSAPKTAASRRLVALDPATVELLRRHRLHQRRAGLALGPGYVDSGLVVCRGGGRPVNPTDWTRVFSRRAHALGLPRIRFHDLRHTHATLGLQAGVHAKVMSERLGHTSTSFTLDVYSHAIPSMQGEAAAVVGRLVFG